MLKIPDVINTDVAHVITGNIIQRACLNITERVIIKKIRINFGGVTDESETLIWRVTTKTLIFGDRY